VATSTYEVVPYDDRPVAETHPDQLWIAARRAGLPIARPETMRVLELGCAHAINLVPMAFHLPQARFEGIDLSPRQVERAQRWIAELGLANLEVHCADVMEFDPGEGTFDVVIAHGLFSWVPDPVRDRVLALCRRALVPSGVAYVSYNAMPAWGIRGAIRRALLEIVGDARDDREKLQRARDGLPRLARIDPLRGTAEGAMLLAEIEGLEHKPDAYLLHEYLEPNSRAYWLRELVDLASAAGLRWVGDVAPTGIDPEAEQRMRAGVSELASDAIAREQIADVLGFRQFRASLLCRDDAPLHPPPEPTSWLAELRLAAPPGEGDAPALGWLRERWPADATLAELVNATGVAPEALVPMIGDRRLQLRPRALPIAGPAPIQRPSVSALCRFEARHVPFVTTPLHEYAPLDAFHAALIAHLDGTRTRAEISGALIDDILAARLRVAGGVTPSRAQLQAAIPELVDAGLGRLRAVGLLLPDQSSERGAPGNRS
jgi:SAM-dependent methyltransferase